MTPLRHAPGGVFARWDAWWFRTGPPHLLAIFRIAFATYLLIEAATYLPHVPVMFSREGLVFAIRSGLPFLDAPPWYVAWAVAWGYVAAVGFLLVGYKTRAALVALLLSFLYYWQLSFYAFPSSYHRLSFLIMLVLLLGGSDKTFSLRMKMARGSWTAWEPIPVLPQRLIAVQLTATYAVVGWQKWWLPMWRGGDVLYYSFIGRWGTPLARWLVSFGLPPAFYDALTLLTKVFESFLPIGFWIPRVRWFCFAGGAVFHLAIALLLGIWWFLVLVPAYIVFFEPETVHAWLRGRFPGIVR